jgi:hypothetical protein
MIGLRDQGAFLHARFPAFRVRYKAGELLADGEVRPTPRSEMYRVRVAYRVGRSPRVHVVTPALLPREPDGAIPHVYPGNELCLYHPAKGEWSGKQAIANTIVPWAIEWLFHYELWHLTGEWHGGGSVHPIVKEGQ